MANTLDKSNIINGNTILPGHVTQSIDALTGTQAYDITISGSLTLTGSVSSLNGFTGNLVGTASWATEAVSAITASHAEYANTASIVENYIDGTRNFTTISPQGTIYTKFEDVYASSSAVGEYDLLNASLTFTGDRTIPAGYAGMDTVGEAKVVHFYINGKIVTGGGSPNPTIDCYVKIGDQELNATKVGAVDLVANSTGPFEIDGKLIFTNNNIRSCVGLGFCNDNDQTFRKYPLSDLYAVGDNAPAGGALQFIVSGSSEDLEMTGSYAYIEFIN